MVWRREPPERFAGDPLGWTPTLGTDTAAGVAVLNHLFDLFTRHRPALIARTEEERAAVFRQRYDIYVREQNETASPGADHARREIRTPEDDLPETTLFYAGSSSNVEASLRLRVWAPGQIPADMRARFSLHRFSDIDTRVVATVGYMMVASKLRGTANMVALSSSAIEWAVTEHGVEMVVANCAPGLLRAYRRLGLRPFGGRLIPTRNELHIPIVGITADLDHVRRVGSPWYPALRRLGARGLLPKRDYQPLLAPLANGGVEEDADRVLACIDALPAGRRSAFLDRLSPKARRELAKVGFVYEIDEGADLFGESIVGQDLFIVLAGTLEARIEGKPVVAMGPGEIVGEVGFFRDTRQRSASVRAASKCTVLHLGQRRIRGLAAKHPEEGVAIYASLAQVLAERLAAWGPDGRRAHHP